MLQSGLNESWWADSMECYTYLRNVTDLLSDGKTPCERRFGQPCKGPIIPFGSLVECHPFYCEGPVKNPSIWKESFTWIVPRIRIVRGENLEGWHSGCRHWGVGDDGRIGNLLKKTRCERGDISQRKRRIYFSSRRWTNQNPWRRSRSENIQLDTASTNSRRKSPWLSWRIRRVSSTTSRLVSGCQRFLWLLDRFHSVYSIRWETSRRIYVVRVETDKKASNIQARWFVARTLDAIGKKCPTEGEAKVVTWKTKTRSCQKITRNLFHWPWGQETQRNHHECSQEIGNTHFSCRALQACKNSQHGVTRGESNEQWIKNGRN